MPLSGGCRCGALRYAIAAEPLALHVCHCRECQKQSASAFGVSLLVPSAAFRLTAGEPRTWSRQTDSGRTLDCMFCPACGCRVWHASPGSGTLTLKGGSLDRPLDLGAAVHIWTSRKLSGVVIPAGATQFAEEPA
jgi:hypothetical protein